MICGTECSFDCIFSSIAKDREKLKELGISHIVNCAQGTKLNQINTDETYFDEAGIKFHGIRALDIFTFKMTPHFQPAAEFIDDALNNGGNIHSVTDLEGLRGRGESVDSHSQQSRTTISTPANRHSNGISLAG